MGFTADMGLCYVGFEVDQRPISSLHHYLKDFLK